MPASLLALGIITSAILFLPFGTLYGENTFSASFAQNIYLIITGLTFYFNYSLFQTLSKEEIDRMLDILCVLMIVLGIIQVGIIFGVPAIGVVYDSIDVLGILPNSNFLSVMHRICMASSEPSGIGQIVCVLLLPYSMGQLLAGNPHRMRYIVYSIILIVLSFFSLSSTVFFGLLVNFAVFVYLKISGRNGVYFLLILGLISVVMVVLWSRFFANTYVGTQIVYLLFEKTTNSHDLSTSYRFSTVINDFFCFIKYPLSGVGNGNQGFFYNETMQRPFIGNEVRMNYQTISAMSGELGVVSGGAFTSAFISGYGLIGIALMIRFLKRCRHTIKAFGESIGCYKYMFYIGGITFLLSSIVSGGLDGNFLVIFVCSLPMMADAEHGRMVNEL